MTKERLQIAKILGPHGVKGAVKLQVLLEDPETLRTLKDIEDETGRPVRLSWQGISGKAVMVRIAGIETREGAEALGKAALFVPRAALAAPEPDEFYAADLVGLKALSAAGEAMGEVIGVQDFGAGPLLEVKRVRGKTVLLPFTEAVVPAIDLRAGQLVLTPPPELWPQE